MKTLSVWLDDWGHTHPLRLLLLVILLALLVAPILLLSPEAPAVLYQTF